MMSVPPASLRRVASYERNGERNGGSDKTKATW